jgi:hypothetical protein
MNFKTQSCGVKCCAVLLVFAALSGCTRVDSRAAAAHLGEQMLEMGCSSARQIIGQEEFAILHGTSLRSL